MKWLFFLATLCLGGFLASAGPPPDAPASADKSQDNLLHPTPDNQLRSFSADRPSQSTGPYTVDAGHFYFETSVLSYLLDEPNAHTTVQQWNVLPFNFRMGLTPNIELDLGYGGYLHVHMREEAPRRSQTQNGLGDFVLQSKINLLGNDSGPVAVGLIPFLKFPTNTSNLGNDSIEGGLSVPFQASLPAGFGLGLQSGVNFVRNSADDGYDPAFINAVLLGHTLFTDKLSTYVEFYSVVTGTSSASHAAFIDTGFVYQILPNASVDFGCNFGLARTAPDYQPFVGLSFRF
ncbi:MAG: transporter [Chthoniobacterales bacterium]